MDDFLDSKTAIQAMAALQDKVRDLESETGQLRKKVTRLRAIVDNSQSELAAREEALSNEADKTEKMLESASETLVELRRLRIENRQLELYLNDLEVKLRDKVKREDGKRKKLEASVDDSEHAEFLLSELEDLFALLLSPPEYDFEKKMNVNFIPTIKSITTYSLPANIQTVIQYLQQLPMPFSAQRTETKREIVKALLKGKAMCCKLIDDIYKLESTKMTPGAQRQAKKTIEAKKSQLYLLITTMSRLSLA